MITQEELKRKLRYDPNTGIFTNLIAKARCKLNQQAGTKHKSGYRKIGINGEIYYEHQLAWLYITGKLPRTTMFHMNGNKTDNRFDNLIDVPNSLTYIRTYGKHTPKE